jgi:hypothetical protein
MQRCTNKWFKNRVPRSHSPKDGGLRRGWEGAEQLLNQLCPICLSFEHFPTTPSFVHREDSKSPVFREGTLVNFCVHNCTFSLEQVLRANGKYIVTTFPLGWNCRIWWNRTLYITYFLVIVSRKTTMLAPPPRNQLGPLTRWPSANIASQRGGIPLLSIPSTF